jgi:hypothetical protein
MVEGCVFSILNRLASEVLRSLGFPRFGQTLLTAGSVTLLTMIDTVGQTTASADSSSAVWTFTLVTEENVAQAIAE